MDFIRNMFNKTLILSFLIVFASNSMAAPAEGDAAKGEKLSIICVDCHGEDGLGDEDFPALAGKDAEYLRVMLMSFKTGARVDENEEMAEIAPDLTDDDIANLAAFYSSLPGK